MGKRLVCGSNLAATCQQQEIGEIGSGEIVEKLVRNWCQFILSPGEIGGEIGVSSFYEKLEKLVSVHFIALSEKLVSVHFIALHRAVIK